MKKQKIINLFVGSNNQGKIKEIRALLPKKLKILTPRDYNLRSPKEYGKTFDENSLLKAKYFSKKTRMICLADDSGLEIDILNKLPGIYSARWGGEEKNFDLAIKRVFEELEKVKKDWHFNNKASFVCCLTIFWPSGKSFSSEGIVNGKITKKSGTNGFGYDPIFIPDGYKNTFGEMSPKLKMSIDHRYKAFLKLKKFF